jgi:hypothetical protein
MRESNAIIAIVDDLSVREGIKPMVDEGTFQSDLYSRLSLTLLAATPNRSSSAVLRYRSSAMWSSLEGSHSRARTRIALRVAQLTSSRPAAKC